MIGDRTGCRTRRCLFRALLKAAMRTEPTTCPGLVRLSRAATLPTASSRTRALLQHASAGGLSQRHTISIARRRGSRRRSTSGGPRSRTCRGSTPRVLPDKTECPVAFVGMTAFTWEEQPARGRVLTRLRLARHSALDELRQRGVRAGEHSRSRRRRDSRPDRAPPSSAWSCVCIVTLPFARSDTTS